MTKQDLDDLEKVLDHHGTLTPREQVDLIEECRRLHRGLATEIRYQGDEIDEVVAKGHIHLEKLDDHHWMLNIDDGETVTMLRLFAPYKVFKPRVECFVFAEESTHQPRDITKRAEMTERDLQAARDAFKKLGPEHEIAMLIGMSLVREVEDTQASADLRHKADMRAIKMWQEATGRTKVWPDHADLCVWLMEENERFEAFRLNLAACLEGERAQGRDTGIFGMLVEGLLRWETPEQREEMEQSEPTP